MRRREFITVIGSVAAWPLTTLAQQPAQMKRVGIVLPFAAPGANHSISADSGRLRVD
jgi:hypothetical protein